MPSDNLQAQVEHDAGKQRKLLRLVVLSDIAVAILLGLLVYLVLGASKRSYEDQAKGIAESIAAITQLSIGAELSRADAVMRTTVDEVQRLRPGVAPDALINQVLLSRLKLMGDLEALRLADASALVRWGNELPPGAPVDISDRDYFVQAKAHVGEQSIVAGPLRSRVSGNWVVGFARPIHVDGIFNGVLYASLGTRHFDEMLSRYEIDEGDAISLRGADQRLFARHSPGTQGKAEIGSTTASNELLLATKVNPRSGAFVSKVLFDGETRTTAYRAVEGWPFVVYVGIGHRRFFKAWERQALQISLLAAFSWTLVVTATWLLYRASTREAEAMREALRHSQRTETLLRVAGEGIHIINHQGVLVEMSDSFAEMLGTTRDDLIGKHVSEWDANQSREQINNWLVSLKDRDNQRVDVQHRRSDGKIIDVALQVRVAEFDGEVLIFGSGRDVTEVRRLAKEKTAMLESTLVGMAKAEGRVFTWTNPSFDKLFGYAPGELVGQSTRTIHVDEASFERVGREGYSRLSAGTQCRTQLRMKKKNGDMVWVDLGAVPLTSIQVLLMAVDVTAEKLAYEQLSHTAFHDPLTQLPNRLLLSDRLNQALAVSARDGTRIAVCYLDLDGFKAVNDAYGHDAGDQLLKEVAVRLLASLRPSDTAARIGGDEFVLLLTAVVADEWRGVLERVVAAIEQPISLADGNQVTVNATIGVTLSEPHETEAELLSRADHLMLGGKRSGKGRTFLG
ncbi:diguanylate cyclase domain-containing protein [Variovorax sp. HJSM1_2]|uniref:bifunctional diguanylate cyclase/phosphodiesterase n=1 Tax=Variovorax sp. HJSM1_2 TaxID=3366263 RepID=UPI003BE13004